MFDAACERIREVARESDLPLPDALRPDAVPGTKMYHVNMSGGWRWEAVGWSGWEIRVRVADSECCAKGDP